MNSINVSKYYDQKILKLDRIKSIYFVLFKAAVRNFVLVKNAPKSIFEVHNQPVFKSIILL